LDKKETNMMLRHKRFKAKNVFLAYKNYTQQTNKIKISLTLDM